MNENTAALRQRINDKLDPRAHLVLAAFKTYGEKMKAAELPVAVATLVRDLLKAFDRIAPPGTTFSKRTNKQIGMVLDAPQSASNPDQLLDLAEAMRKIASAKEKLLADAVRVPLKLPRPNRDPKPVFKKMAHGMILFQLLFFGSLPQTDSDFSTGRHLDNEELKVVFDSYCPACQAPHKIETVKKLKTRFLKDVLARASKYKGKRVTRIRISATDSARSQASRRQSRPRTLK